MSYIFYLCVKEYMPLQSLDLLLKVKMDWGSSWDLCNAGDFTENLFLL
jgi:hypothetical protein